MLWPEKKTMRSKGVPISSLMKSKRADALILSIQVVQIKSSIQNPKTVESFDTSYTVRLQHPSYVNNLI